MWLIRAALRRPITILVTVIAVALAAVLAVSRISVRVGAFCAGAGSDSRPSPMQQQTMAASARDA